MRLPLVVLVVGLLLSVLGTATATDAVSLRELCQAIPLVGQFVTELRLGMGTQLAHALEPALGVFGAGVMLLALSVSPARARRALRPVRV